MPKGANEVGFRIWDERGHSGPGPWEKLPRLGELSIQAWAREWNGARVQLQLSHDGEHAVDIDGALLSEENSGMFGVPSGVHLRAVVVGNPVGLVVSAAPVTERG